MGIARVIFFAEPRGSIELPGSFVLPAVANGKIDLSLSTASR